MQRSVSVQSTTTGTYAGKKKTKTISYVNPSATKNQIQSTITNYVGLSTNVYNDATVNDKYSLSEIKTENKIQVTVESTTGKITVKTTDTNATPLLFYTTDNSTWTLINNPETSTDGKIYTIENFSNVQSFIVGISENTNYQSAFYQWQKT